MNDIRKQINHRLCSLGDNVKNTHISDLLKKDIPIHEIGYICLTRKHGKSKTANNIFDLAIKGWPYIKAAFISRIE